VDISTTLSLKLQALEIYHSEMRPWPHARSLQAVEHLAKWRGASVGVPAAEAFMLVRNLIK
jgi:N-acetylglucosamine malate deacetylase 1